MDSEKVLLRKYEDDLNISGVGVIVLGAWSVVKLIMEILTSDVTGFMVDMEGVEKTIAIVVTIVIIGIILLLSFLIFRIHLYIGSNASRAARGKDYKKGYYKGAIIMLVISVLGCFTYIYSIKDVKNIDTTIAAFLVDATTAYVFWTVISSTNKIKKIKSKLLQEG